MHIYAFGSVCRGDVSIDSDVDLLAIVDGEVSRFDPNAYSIYSYRRVRELWGEGNPFAWHLSLESMLLFSSDKSDYLKALGNPRPYRHCVRDCERFLALFREGYDSILTGKPSTVFDLSTIFLSVRNFATCFSLGVTGRPVFSRNSALCLGDRSLSLPEDSYHVLERARILCTRGQGANILRAEIDTTVQRLDEVRDWMNKLVDEAKRHERIQ
jgi:hypothetical protein